MKKIYMQSQLTIVNLPSTSILTTSDPYGDPVIDPINPEVSAGEPLDDDEYIGD